MPAPRRKRTSYNSRRVSLAVPQVLPYPVVRLAEIGEFTARFLWEEPPGELVIAGLPQMLAIGPGELPIAIVAINQVEFTLQYLNAIDEASGFFLPQFDPAIRPRWGGYISAGFFAAVEEPAPIFYQAQWISEHEVQIIPDVDPSEYPALVMPSAAAEMSIPAILQTSGSYTPVGNNFNVVFGGDDIAPGMFIEAVSGQGVLITIGGRALVEGPVEITA